MLNTELVIAKHKYLYDIARNPIDINGNIIKRKDVVISYNFDIITNDNNVMIRGYNIYPIGDVALDYSKLILIRFRNITQLRNSELVNLTFNLRIKPDFRSVHERHPF